MYVYRPLSSVCGRCDKGILARWIEIVVPIFNSLEDQSSIIDNRRFHQINVLVSKGWNNLDITGLSGYYSPDLCDQEGYHKSQDNREDACNGGPLPAFGFHINGINSGAAWIVQQAEQHQVYSC